MHPLTGTTSRSKFVAPAPRVTGIGSPSRLSVHPPSPLPDRPSSFAGLGGWIQILTRTDGQVSAARWFTAALLVAAPTPLAAQAKPDWAAFDKYVAKAAAEWRIPALAIAVVKDDSVVFAKGYGVLQKGTSQPANEHTRFAIGSTTKAMTAASIAMLVDEGKLKLDDPVTKYIPELQLSDPWVTRELTIRDLLTHRSGLPGADLFWASSWKYSQADIIRGLRYIRPTASFRSTWQYHNVLYALNGLIIERVSGMPWEQFV